MKLINKINRNVPEKNSMILMLEMKKNDNFAPQGEMAEWSKAHAWKVCNRQKRFMGSNPILSAIKRDTSRFSVACKKELMGNRQNFDFMAIFGLFMVVIYIGVGLYLLLTDTFNYIPMHIKVVFAAFFILYGIFRFVRIYPKIRNKKNYYDEE
jgi:hypothetical protein